jgi:Mg2+-importing ATPase
MRFIGWFMIEFGVVSSFFDFVMFGTLLGLFAATPVLFRTGWFTESLLTELVIALVVRTRRPFFRSRPGFLLLSLTIGVAAAAFLIPYSPGVGVLGFAPMPVAVPVMIVIITLLYVTATELAKAHFYQRFD